MKKISKLKSGFFSRQIGMAKLAFKTGKDLYRQRDHDLKSKLQNGLGGHIDEIVQELGVMKGSLMKAGQLLATYGQAILPPEAQKVLKKLENQSYYLPFEALDIPNKWKQELKINETPLAAASLGQVHLARTDSQVFAMKVQYPGVRKAIKNDIRALKFLLNSLKLIPKDMNLDDLYLEIEQMLRQETDYLAEAQHTIEMGQLLQAYPQYTVPEIIEIYSHERILTSSFLEGTTIRENNHLTQKQRDQLGIDLLRLLFLELFEFNLIQTDVHFGNYLILPDATWGLIDFGASKKPPQEFIRPYQQLIVSLANLNQSKFFEYLYQMGYLSQDKRTDHDFFWQYAQLLATPFQAGIYDWGKSTIADQVLEYVPQVLKKVSFGKVPRHTFFIDRKIGGTYFMLQKLGARFDAKKILAEFTPIDE